MAAIAMASNSVVLYKNPIRSWADDTFKTASQSEILIWMGGIVFLVAMIWFFTARERKPK